MNETLLISILAASITAGTPILFAALGELISERAGVTNLGVDGMMLVGACAGFIAAQQTGSLLSGVGMALLAGSLISDCHPAGKPGRQRFGADLVWHGSIRLSGFGLCGAAGDCCFQ